jgi:hypothetical protein
MLSAKTNKALGEADLGRLRMAAAGQARPGRPIAHALDLISAMARSISSLFLPGWAASSVR